MYVIFWGLNQERPVVDCAGEVFGVEVAVVKSVDKFEQCAHLLGVVNQIFAATYGFRPFGGVEDIFAKLVAVKRAFDLYAIAVACVVDSVSHFLAFFLIVNFNVITKFTA